MARIEVYAAADPLEITGDELLRDTRAEVEALSRACATLTEEELMRDVYITFQFDLCRRCQRAYISAPLAPAGGA